MSIITLDKGTIGHWLPEGPDVQGSINLDKLSDVTVTTPLAGQVLKYVAPVAPATVGQWVNTSTGAITTIDSLSDVVITSVQDGQSLQYDNATGNWVNRDITANSIDGGTY